MKHLAKKIAALAAICCLTLFTAACSNSEVIKKYTITDFTKSITDTLSPVKGEIYTTQLIKLKGQVDDTIFVSFGKGTYKHYFVNDIDITINPDYYGGHDAIFVFDPYRATKGKLDIKFSIQ